MGLFCREKSGITKKNCKVKFTFQLQKPIRISKNKVEKKNKFGYYKIHPFSHLKKTWNGKIFSEILYFLKKSKIIKKNLKKKRKHAKKSTKKSFVPKNETKI